jgi:dTDP-L-rhamnose 4-epimerase
MNVLITGGAGFIGTRLARRLLCEGHSVTILDSFSPQIHGRRALPELAAAKGQELLNGECEPAALRIISGDVTDEAALAEALEGQTAVVHLAAETGTGQSMYEVERYERVNIGGTALLMDLLVNAPARTVQKLVVASSRAIYGEGKYSCLNCGVVYPGARRAEAMREGRFEPECPRCGAPCMPLPTDEATPLSPASFYGLTKQVQEQTTLLFARSLGISAFALRYQNVYGPGQSLKNPYTGILAIFAGQARAGQPINIFEDGAESRDFVYIDDVVEATWRCLRPEASGAHVLNVGSGERVSVAEVAAAITAFFASDSRVTITGAFREGDIRHNYADLTLARELLGFVPRWSFEAGINEFLRWAGQESLEQGGYERSLQELRARGLFHG